MLIPFAFWKPPAAAAGPIALTGSPASQAFTADVSTHTLAYTLGAVTAGTNRKFIVPAAANPGDLVNNAITCAFAGQPMTSAVDRSNGEGRLHLFYLDDEDLPTTAGPHNIVLSIAGDTCFAIIGTPGCYINVAQGAPSSTGGDDAAVGAATSITLNSVSEGALVIDAALNTAGTSFTPGANQTERFDVAESPPGWTLACADQIGVTAGNIASTQDPGAAATAAIAAWWAKAA